MCKSCFLEVQKHNGGKTTICSESVLEKMNEVRIDVGSAVAVSPSRSCLGRLLPLNDFIVVGKAGGNISLLLLTFHSGIEMLRLHHCWRKHIHPILLFHSVSVYKVKLESAIREIVTTNSVHVNIATVDLQ